MVSRSPPVMFDVTHTPDGAREVASEVRRLVGDHLVLVMGVLDDKDVEGIAAQFGPLARAAVATAPDTPRAFPPGRVAGALRPYVAEVLVSPDILHALDRAVEIASGDTVLVTGSLYTIGEAYRWLDGRKADQ